MDNIHKTIVALIGSAIGIPPLRCLLGVILARTV
jgi:hypothetical protein